MSWVEFQHNCHKHSRRVRTIIGAGAGTSSTAFGVSHLKVVHVEDTDIEVNADTQMRGLEPGFVGPGGDPI